MDKNVLNISAIESYLHKLLNNKVSSHTFVGELPNTIDSSWQDMCLIDMGGAIKDLDAYGYGLVNIFLLARPRQGGIKNVAKLSEMEKKLNEALSSIQNSNYQLNRHTTYSDFDSEHKWHCNIVVLNLIIY